MTENFKLVKVFPGAPKTVRGRPSALNVHPLGTKLLYCNGNSVFIRDIDDPTDCDIYTQHARETTCAAYSPSGYYICSGDASGKIKIWDTINPEHLTKYEYQVLGGAIKDIQWSEDSKKIAVCGDGKEVYCKVINWDTGTTCGSMSGPNKSCNNMAMRQQRPFRLALASEDYSTYFFENIPFKLTEQLHEHKNFVNCARYSPDGNKFVTAGADGKCFIYEGKTGKLENELNEAAGKIHKGGVYGVAWSPDNNHLLTVSADKTAKIWLFDPEVFQSNKECITFPMGDDIGDMQVACAWAKTTLLTVSLNGNINYLNADTQKIEKSIKGHVKAIVNSCLTSNKETLFTSSFDGKVMYWNLQSGYGEYVEGKGHEAQVQNMVRFGDSIATCGIDDTVRLISVSDKSYVDGKVIRLESQPQRIAAGDNVLVLACNGKQVATIKNEKVTYTSINYEPTCVAVSSALNKVAVGTDHSKVLLFEMMNQGDGVVLNDAGYIATHGNITDLQFSPDNSYLAISTGKKQVKVVDTQTFDGDILNENCHAVKVNGVSWSPNSKFLASCGVDGSVYVYSVDKKEKCLTMRGCHAHSIDITSVQWSSDYMLLTTGRQDCSVKMWKVLLE